MSRFDPSLVAEWCGGSWQGGKPSEISGVTTDSRLVKPGEMFVALSGENFDGHDFLEKALANGASSAMMNRDGYSVSIEGASLLLVDDTRRALLNMAAGYRKSVNPVVVAVTGSVGKTTVKEMIADVLSSRYATARTRGNWNNDIGMPLSVLSMDPDAEAAVFEVGMNHPGELDPLCRALKPDIGVITRIGPVHMEFFESEEDIAREKAVLLDCLPDNGTAVFSADDPHASILREHSRSNFISVGLESRDVGIAGAQGKDGTVEIMESGTGEKARFVLDVPGLHQVSNALLACAAGRAVNIPWEGICRALESFRGQPMRWECSSVANVTFINDAYNANPLSMRAAVRAFRDMPAIGRKWLVLGDMLELGGSGPDRHEKLGHDLAGNDWEGLFTVGKLGKIIARGALEAGMESRRVRHFEKHRDLADALSDILNGGDAVLLKASRGMHLETILELIEKKT